MSEDEIKAALSIVTEVSYGMGDDGITVKLMWYDEVISEDYVTLG